MTLLKGHGAVPGSESPHHPTLPGRARPCRAIALLLPAPPVPAPKAAGSALASLRGFGAGAGGWLQAGRRQAIGMCRHRSTLRSLLFVFLSFWAFCFKGSALRMFSFTCTCRCNSLPSDAPFFLIWENPRRVLQDGPMKPGSYQHTLASAISLQTKPAGLPLAIPSEI